MPLKKKPVAKKSPRRRVPKRLPTAPEWTLGLPGEQAGSNGTQYEYQHIKNPQTAEEREKWLEKRNKLTLRAFQIAYKNHNSPKSS